MAARGTSHTRVYCDEFDSPEDGYCDHEKVLSAAFNLLFETCQLVYGHACSELKTGRNEFIVFRHGPYGQNTRTHLVTCWLIISFINKFINCFVKQSTAFPAKNAYYIFWLIATITRSKTFRWPEDEEQ